MDEDLPKRLASGDMAAYRRLYDLFGQPLFRTALRMLGSWQDAEDAVQEVFVAMVRSRTLLADVTNMRAYLFSSLRHVVARLSQRPRLLGLEASGLAEEPAADEDSDRERLWAMAGRLPIEQREVLVLKIQGGLTFQEIALSCGISVNTAGSRYRYALEKLKQMAEIKNER